MSVLGIYTTSQAFHQAPSPLALNCLWKLQIPPLIVFICFYFLTPMRPKSPDILWSLPKGQYLIDSHTVLHRNTSYGNFITSCPPAWRHLAGLLMFATAEAQKKKKKRPKKMLLEKVRRRKTMKRLDRCVLQKGVGQATSDNNPLRIIILVAVSWRY